MAQGSDREQHDPGDEDDGEFSAQLERAMDRLCERLEAWLDAENHRRPRGIPTHAIAGALILGCCGQGVICFGERHDFACPAAQP